MVNTVSLVFHAHQPLRLKNYRVFDIGNNHYYFNKEKNQSIIHKIRDKCYLPANNVLLQLMKKTKHFRIAFSITGVLIEQLEDSAPEVLESFKRLAKTGRLEFLSETYYHSLSSLYSQREFQEQVEQHKELIKEVFHQTPKIFRNTELIYNNNIARVVYNMGFKGIVAEGVDHILKWRSPNYVYKAKTADIKLLLKNYRLSDDVAFRFSQKSWVGYPLTADKFAEWIASSIGEHAIIYVDYETFGEHQWQDTGILEFLKALPKELEYRNIKFSSLSELAKKPAVDDLDVNNTISWADTERDTSAWTGNQMQQQALKELYNIEQAVRACDDPIILRDWRLLQLSDHFYYMCTKWFADGDVHKYFNPYETPYEGFIAFMNALNDLALRVKQKLLQKLNKKKPNNIVINQNQYMKQASFKPVKPVITEEPGSIVADMLMEIKALEKK